MIIDPPLQYPLSPNMKEKTNHSEHVTAEIKKSSELEKSKTHIVVEVLHYIPNSVVSKTILKCIVCNRRRI